MILINQSNGMAHKIYYHIQFLKNALENRIADAKMVPEGLA